MRLIVDGYNVVHAWPQVKAMLTSHNLAQARLYLVRRLAEYHAVSGTDVIVVFDSHSRAPVADDAERVDGVEVRYGSSHDSADHIIERLCNRAVRAGTAGGTVVVTNDGLERAIVSAMGVATMTVAALIAEVGGAMVERSRQAERQSAGGLSAGRLESRIDPRMREHLERLRRGEGGGGG